MPRRCYPALMIRMTLATLAFLAAATAFLFAAAQNDTADNPVVITVNDQDVTLDAFERRFDIAMRSIAAQQGMELTDDLRAQLEPFKADYLTQRANEIAILQAALEDGLAPSEDEVEEELAGIQEQVGGDEAFANLLTQSGIGTVDFMRVLVRENQTVGAFYSQAEAQVDISNEQIEAYYQDQQDQFTSGEQACARHILVDDVATANEVLTALADGGDFAELAGEYSTGPTGESGGDLGCFGRGQMVPPFEEAVFTAEIGTPVGPVETQFGQHVILVSERTDATVQPLEEVRGQIVAQLEQEGAAAVVDATIEAASIATYPDRLPTLNADDDDTQNDE